MRVHSRQLIGLSALLIAASAPGLAQADSLNDLPRDAAEAADYYESDPDLWAKGPVSYLLLDSERDVLETLETTEQRAAFIQWFWDRRNPDPVAPRNAARDEFYSRVATANSRYHDFPHGWKSDRGQIHIVLGAPDSVRPSFGYTMDATVWSFYTVGPNATEVDFGSLAGNITVAFLKSDRRGGYQIYGGFGGPGMMPLYVRDALNYSKLAAIVDLSLTGSFGD